MSGVRSVRPLTPPFARSSGPPRCPLAHKCACFDAVTPQAEGAEKRDETGLPPRATARAG